MKKQFVKYWHGRTPFSQLNLYKLKPVLTPKPSRRVTEANTDLKTSDSSVPDTKPLKFGGTGNTM